MTISLFQILRNASALLGMNERNLHYVRPLNLMRAREIADDKLLSKKVLTKIGVPVPSLIAKIQTRQELDSFNWSKLPSSWVLKPNRGFGGGGILIVFARKKGQDDAWVKADGSIVTIADIKAHIRNILEGAFSVSGAADTAFFEERLTLLKLFKPYSYRGIPDVRIIVYNRVPVMAMLRLPTRQSDGKANLHLGGVGVGIDMATGVTTSAVQGKSKIIEYAPETRMLLSGIKIPYWKDILQMAVRAQDASGLGFLGADVSIDREKGPVFLELNARPGLSIQVANLAGLRSRLDRVRGLTIKSVAHGVRVGRDLFGGEIEEELENVSGKKVIGSIEKITLIGKDEKKVDVEAKIDTGAYSTSIDRELARELGFSATLDAFDKIDIAQFDIIPGNEASIKKYIMEKHSSSIDNLVDVAVVFSSSGSSIRPMVKLSFIMDNVHVLAKVNITNRTHLKYPMIIGKRNLNKFLVDVSK